MVCGCVEGFLLGGGLVWAGGFGLGGWSFWSGVLLGSGLGSLLGAWFGGLWGGGWGPGGGASLGRCWWGGSFPSPSWSFFFSFGGVWCCGFLLYGFFWGPLVGGFVFLLWVWWWLFGGCVGGRAGLGVLLLVLFWGGWGVLLRWGSLWLFFGSFSLCGVFVGGSFGLGFCVLCFLVVCGLSLLVLFFWSLGVIWGGFWGGLLSLVPSPLRRPGPGSGFLCGGFIVGGAVVLLAWLVWLMVGVCVWAPCAVFVPGPPRPPPPVSPGVLASVAPAPSGVSTTTHTPPPPPPPLLFKLGVGTNTPFFPHTENHNAPTLWCFGGGVFLVCFVWVFSVFCAFFVLLGCFWGGVGGVWEGLFSCVLDLLFPETSAAFY